MQSCIVGNFEGWSGDTLFELCNGQLWVQTSFDYAYDFAFRPDVVIVLSGGTHKMFVEGMEKSVTVAQASLVVRSCIDGAFEGWEGETLFPLCNGQVWQQASFDFNYHYAYRPEVLIYNFNGTFMRVEGVDEVIRVRLLR